MQASSYWNFQLVSRGLPCSFKPNSHKHNLSLGLIFKIVLNIWGGKNNAQNIKNLLRMYTDFIYFIYMQFLSKKIASPALRLQASATTPSFLCWMLEFQTQMLTLVWQVLYLMSYLPNPSLHTNI